MKQRLLRKRLTPWGEFQHQIRAEPDDANLARPTTSSNKRTADILAVEQHVQVLQARVVQLADLTDVPAKVQRVKISSSSHDVEKVRKITRRPMKSRSRWPLKLNVA